MNTPSFEQIDFGEPLAACEQGYVYAPYVPIFRTGRSIGEALDRLQAIARLARDGFAAPGTKEVIVTSYILEEAILLQGRPVCDVARELADVLRVYHFFVAGLRQFHYCKKDDAHDALLRAGASSRQVAAGVGFLQRGLDVVVLEDGNIVSHPATPAYRNALRDVQLGAPYEPDVEIIP